VPSLVLPGDVFAHWPLGPSCWTAPNSPLDRQWEGWRTRMQAWSTEQGCPSSAHFSLHAVQLTMLQQQMKTILMLGWWYIVVKRIFVIALELKLMKYARASLVC
jgi:hypothetical protein